MATIKYYVFSSKDTAQIYLRFSASRELVLKSKVGFIINPKDWSNNTNLPKPNSESNKVLSSKLQKLKLYILEKYNEAQGTEDAINLHWLKENIDSCFSRHVRTDSKVLLKYIQFIIDNASIRKVKGKNKLGISESRVKSYITFKNLMSEYENHLKSTITLLDIDRLFVTNFTKWLLELKKYSTNYAGKQLDNLKTVCLDAQKNGIKINDYVPFIERFSEANEDRLIATLSFDEIDKIKKLKTTSKALENARKWILIGCEIGQRGNDLLALTKENIRYNNKGYYIDLIQQKTKKNVTVSLIDEFVIEIIENDFPKSISIQKLNTYIKQVCKLAGIDEPIEGKKINPNTKRKETGMYPKYELISSHCFRRSFATNYYKKVPTAILIGITGHSKESLFLQYINQNEDKDSNADLFRDFHKKLNADKPNQIKILKHG